jgi:hypothetical protein
MVEDDKQIRVQDLEIRAVLDRPLAVFPSMSLFGELGVG